MIVGVVLGVIGFVWLIVRQLDVWKRKSSEKRLQAPFSLLVVAALVAASPILINSLAPKSKGLGALNPLVGEERHLTLTGWKRSDYQSIAPAIDTVVLQMANPDVKDSTLKYIADFKSLREIDLNNTQITDASLELFTKFPRLRDLRLANTKITDEGFRQHLMGKDSLMNLELTGTKVTAETIEEWKAAKPNRKTL